jgi:Heterokaryon incompatibility protein (HET)
MTRCIHLLLDKIFLISSKAFRAKKLIPGYPPSCTCFGLMLSVSNQADPAEKAAQISLMGDVYNNASLVFAWLGNLPPQLDTVVWMNDCFLKSLLQRRPPDVSLEDYLGIINRINPNNAGFWLTHTGLQPKECDWATCWHILLRFLQRTRWFRRCWILQEFCLARECHFICGTTVFQPNFECLPRLRSAILTIEYYHHTNYNLEATLRLFELRRDINPWTNNPDSILPLQKIHSHVALCLHWTRLRDISLEADRVYSIIGIMRKLLGKLAALDLATPSPDRLVTDVFTWAATWLLENGPDFLLLSLVEPRKSTSYVGMPSWVPDFSSPLGCESPIQNSRSADATLVDKSRSRPPGLEVRGNALKVSGREIGQIRQYVAPLPYLAMFSIFMESEDYEAWLAESMPNLEAQSLAILANITRNFMKFCCDIKILVDDYRRLC